MPLVPNALPSPGAVWAVPGGRWVYGQCRGLLRRFRDEEWTGCRWDCHQGPGKVVGPGRPRGPFPARPGRRVRIRLVNTGSDTVFRVALAGHRLTITHTDGYPVLPRATDRGADRIGEQVDVETTLADRVVPLVARSPNPRPGRRSP